MKRFLSGDEPRLLRMARDLLSIAKLAMPDTYYQSDSRCKRARKIIKELTEMPKFCQFCAKENSKEHDHQFCGHCKRIIEHCECPVPIRMWPKKGKKNADVSTKNKRK